MGSSSFSWWQQSTARDCRKLPDFIWLDALPSMLVAPTKGQRSPGAAQAGLPDFLGQAFSAWCFSTSPGSAAVAASVENAALLAPLGGLVWEQEPEQWEGSAWRLSPFPAHPLKQQTLASSDPGLSHRSHEGKVANCGKSLSLYLRS